MEVINSTKNADLPGAPFSSLEEAEAFLSASEDNMTLVKTIFTNCQETLKILDINKKLKKKPAQLPSRHILEFMFTSDVLDTLSNWKTFRYTFQSWNTLKMAG